MKKVYIIILITIMLFIGQIGIYLYKDSGEFTWYSVIYIALSLFMILPAYAWWYTYFKKVFKIEDK